MQRDERVAENLNRAMSTLLADDPRVILLGEDIQDPYGGAFKVTRGLSSRFPGRVLNTPISEQGFLGVANGLALCGDRPIVEIMFADFVLLGFDQIVNFAAKAVDMFGRLTPMHLVVRCPFGGGRGYGPTHSQSPQKHFLGVPRLVLAEVSAFHDAVPMLADLMSRGEPCLLFEHKLLYARPMHVEGRVDDIFSFDFLDAERRLAHVYADQPDDDVDCLVIAPGGVAERAVAAARWLLLEREINCQVVVPAQLFPLELAPLLPLVARARLVCVAEEGTTGGSWGEFLAQRLYDSMWESMRGPVRLMSSAASVIPSAVHLEEQVLLRDMALAQAIEEVLADA
jgi:pyruvate/2-oxoglutarate/acetoin dehydrogenase E1 component